MKQKKLFSALVLTLVLLCGITIGAGASGAVQAITAYLDPTITVKLDGEAQNMLDSNGARIYPITYNGSTYLPVRAVAGLADLEVNWDQATRTVELGQMKGVDLVDTFTPYDTKNATQVQSSAKETREISGTSYSHWLRLKSAGNNHPCWASYALGGKYNTLTFQYYCDSDVTLQVLGENETVLAEIPVKGGQVAQSITVNILGTNQLTFKTDQAWVEDTFIFDAHLE